MMKEIHPKPAAERSAEEVQCKKPFFGNTSAAVFCGAFIVPIAEKGYNAHDSYKNDQCCFKREYADNTVYMISRHRASPIIAGIPQRIPAMTII